MKEKLLDIAARFHAAQIQHHGIDGLPKDAHRKSLAEAFILIKTSEAIYKEAKKDGLLE